MLCITKRQLVSEIAKTFDVLGWFSPTLIKAKILLQHVWEHRIDWDDTVPLPIILTNPLKLPYLNSMDSLMLQNMPMPP